MCTSNFKQSDHISLSPALAPTCCEIVVAKVKVFHSLPATKGKEKGISSGKEEGGGGREGEGGWCILSAP